VAGVELRMAQIDFEMYVSDAAGMGTDCTRRSLKRGRCAIVEPIARHMPSVLANYKHRMANAATVGGNSEIAAIQTALCRLRNRHQ
jgi:hypothetical protein